MYELIYIYEDVNINGQFNNPMLLEIFNDFEINKILTDPPPSRLPSTNKTILKVILKLNFYFVILCGKRCSSLSINWKVQISKATKGKIILSTMQHTKLSASFLDDWIRLVYVQPIDFCRKGKI